MSPSLLIKKVGQDARYVCRSFKDRIWTFNNGKLPSNVVFEMSNLILVIQNIQFHNVGFYQCTTYDQLNNKHTESGELRLARE